jgi:hypothetical protein
MTGFDLENDSQGEAEKKREEDYSIWGRRERVW